MKNRYRLIEFALPGGDRRNFSWLAGELAAGRPVVGCWQIAIGGPRRLLMLVRDTERRVTGEQAIVGEETTYVPLPGLPGLPDVAAATAWAALAEIRTYRLLPGALEAAVTGWRENVAVRLAIAPILGVLHSEGTSPMRLLHIYPYTSLAEREAVRAQAVETGRWPPKGGSLRNEYMHAELGVPLQPAETAQ